MPSEKEISLILEGIPGGYTYRGACSFQICFPLKAGGELRFSWVDKDIDKDHNGNMQIDLYNGALLPCITGVGKLTGESEDIEDA
jgi:hypothetical protein